MTIARTEERSAALSSGVSLMHNAKSSSPVTVMIATSSNIVVVGWLVSSRTVGGYPRRQTASRVPRRGGCDRLGLSVVGTDNQQRRVVAQRFGRGVDHRVLKAAHRRRRGARTQLGEDGPQAIFADTAAIGGAALADPIGVHQQAVPGTHLSAEDREHALGE